MKASTMVSVVTVAAPSAAVAFGSAATLDVVEESLRAREDDHHLLFHGLRLVLTLLEQLDHPLTARQL